MNYYNKSKEEVLEFFKTDETNGLSTDAVSSLKEEFGENKLKEKAKKTLAKKTTEKKAEKSTKKTTEKKAEKPVKKATVKKTEAKKTTKKETAKKSTKK